MASNALGNLFKITTWGESHGPAIGVVIDGCPAGLALTEADINQELKLRAPGSNPYTTPRKEPDTAEIYSGVFEAKTTGAPIAIIIKNRDADSSKYEPIKHLMRPGHANYTYIKKYGCFDYRGGGRASARETACRVAAGAVAQKLLNYYGIRILSYIKSIGAVKLNQTPAIETNTATEIEQLASAIQASPIFCPEPSTEAEMMQAIETVKADGDSLGGIVEFAAVGLPVGLGEPIYEKLEANLAKAMLSLPASKGFEIGEGFAAACLRGSEHNDAFSSDKGLASNRAGGTLGGISTGLPLLGRVAFKPTSSIAKTQATIDADGKDADFNLPKGSRHDPCVAIRAVPVVRAMCQLIVADHLLMARAASVGQEPLA